MSNSNVEAAISERLFSAVGYQAIAADAPQPWRAKQNPGPNMVTYQRVGADRVASTEGPSGLAKARLQIDVWCKDHINAKTLADIIRDSLDGFTKSIMTANGFSPPVDFFVDAIIMDDEREMGDPDTDYYRVSQIYNVWYREQ